jgi:hypothetical protein
MSLTTFERRLTVVDCVLLVRDFRDARKAPVFSELKVFDRTGKELEEFHRVVIASERVDTMKEVRTAINERHRAQRRQRHG